MSLVSLTGFYTEDEPKFPHLRWFYGGHVDGVHPLKQNYFYANSEHQHGRRENHPWGPLIINKNKKVFIDSMFTEKNVWQL